MYPLKFEPIYKKILWGGRKLEKKGRILPDGKIAESWDLSVREDDQSLISNGKFKGERFVDIIKKYGSEIIGEKLKDDYIMNFPMLVKILDANDDLSVQVHPTDEYAEMYEGQPYGKDETWIILDIEEGAQIIYGLKEDLDRDSFAHKLDEEGFENCLNYIKVRLGEVYNVYPGLVHAMRKGVLALEIQQNSNTTYRVYDYNRTDDKGNKRELHAEKALDVIDFNKKKPLRAVTGQEKQATKDFILTSFVENKHYTLEKLKIETQFTEDTKNERFYVYFVISGTGIIKNRELETSISGFDTILIPAGIGRYTIQGKIELVRAYMTFDNEI